MNHLIQTIENFSLPKRNKYPIEAMQVGDFIHIEDYKTAQSARVSATQFARRRQLEWRFSIRKMRDGWRIFRTY